MTRTDRSKRDSDSENDARIAVFTGVFDPITLGHIDIIRRASKIFPRLIVGVGSNAEKVTMFTASERVELIRRSTTDIEGVEVESFSGMAVQFVRSCGSSVIVRGVRGVADMDYELTMARTNRTLVPGTETLFLPAIDALAHVSSTLIRQIAREATRKELARFVPPAVLEALWKKFRSS